MDKNVEFTSSQSKFQCLFALLYIPVHVLLMPQLVIYLFPELDAAELNFICYAVGAVLMLLTQWTFLKRDWGRFMDRPGKNLVEIALSYGIMLCFNFLVGVIILLIGLLMSSEFTNPNNEAVLNIAAQNSNLTVAMSVYLAPIIEELMFRAGLFGLIRKRSRLAAYLVSILAFSLYHVWGFAIEDPSYLLSMVQYIPVTLLLCRCYERTDSIWGSIFFHMAVNFISLKALTLLEGLI